MGNRVYLLIMMAFCPILVLRAAGEEPAALAEGSNGVVVGTSSPLAVHAGLEILKKGGSAADAAMATALAQVVECGGSYVSHAGILSMVYYDAKSGQVHYLNACYNTPREEKDPLSIPGPGKPSGRSALVPGFMMGVQAAHDRFGKLPRQTVFTPAIEMAEQGIKVNPLLGRFLQARKGVLSRLPGTKRIFTKEDGGFFTEGEQFRQLELARTLRQVAEQGAAYMYTGPWAQQFVEAVKREGGVITLEDMKEYRVHWEEPLRHTYRGHQLCLPGMTSLGGVAMKEALYLLERADLPKHGHYATTPLSLFWLMQISHCQVLGFLPGQAQKNFEGLDVSPASRIKKETADAIWQRMQDGKWTYSSKLRSEKGSPGSHSDGIVVIDRWGNMAAVTHSINTVLWGDTGLFVGGISIPDSAAIQKQAVKEAGAGKRLPDPMCPLIVLKEGKPVLGSSAIGGGLHPLTLQVLTSFLDFGMDPQTAIEQPTFMLPSFTAFPPGAQVDRGKFDTKTLDSVRALGQPIRELSQLEAGGVRGYWVGAHITTKNLRRGIGTRSAPLPGVAEGY